jgi:phenylpropionate dioxygenase-like ring-hydroxylating dioxygenase large terminal subunit
MAGDANPTRFGQGYLTDAWYFAALSRDLKPGKLKRLRMMGRPVMLGRTPSGEVTALSDICPHRAAPLSAGRFAEGAGGETQVECPYHGWRFGADGRCRAIPSLVEGQTFDVSRVRVRAYPTAESQGMVFIWVAADERADAAPDGPPPMFPGVVGGAPKLVLRDTFDAHIDHAVVGLMDPAHGPFVHRQWWWRTASSLHAKAKRFEPSPEGFTMVRHPPSSNSRAYTLLGGEPLTEITFRLPGFRWEHITVGRRQVLALTCLTPIDETTTAITQILWSDHRAFTLLRPLVALGARRFLDQDRAMIDLQKAGLRHDPALLWIDDADRQAKWYQALKREWRASRTEGRPFVNPVTASTLEWTS